MEILLTLSTNKAVVLASSTTLPTSVSVTMDYVVIVLNKGGTSSEKDNEPPNNQCRSPFLNNIPFKIMNKRL
jgi:hypothetical protein